MKLTQEIINQAMQAFGAGEFSRVISTLSPVYEQHPMAKMVYATALGQVAEFTTIILKTLMWRIIMGYC